MRIGLAAAAALHILGFLFLVLIPSPPRSLRFSGGAVTVSLVSLSGSGAEKPRTALGPAPLLNQPPSLLEKRVPSPRRAKPETQGQVVKTAAPSDARTPTAQASPARGSAAGADSLAGSGGGGSSWEVSAQGDGGPFVYDYYLHALSERISKVWVPPTALAGRGGETAATVRFRVMSNGSVPIAEVESPSSIEIFDRSAREAVLRAQPFPPLPPAYGGRWLMVHLTFRFAPEGT